MATANARLDAPSAGATPRRGWWRAAVWLAFAATCAALVANITLWAAKGFDVPQIRFSNTAWVIALEWVLVIIPGTVGLLLGLRIRGNWVGPLFALIGLTVGLQNLANSLTLYPEVVSTRIGITVAWAASTFTFPVAALFTILLISVFPRGHLFGPRWVIPIWIGIAAFVLQVMYQGFAPGTMTWYRQLENPYAVQVGFEGVLRIGWYLSAVLFSLSLVGAAMSMVARYRAANGVERQQLKWFTYGLAALVVSGVLEIAAFILLPVDSQLGELSLVLLFIGGSVPPIAAAVAITRHRLYEIDHLIDQTFVFGALTAILAGLYAAGIRLFNGVFIALTGEESDGALVLTTLVLATTFTPIKARLEGVVARRYREPATDGAVSAPMPAATSGPEAARTTSAVPGPAADAELRALIAAIVAEELDRRASEEGE